MYFYFGKVWRFCLVSSLKSSIKYLWTCSRLTQFAFTTRKTELDAYHSNKNTQVASWVVHWLKTSGIRKLRKFKKTPETLGIECKYPADHSKRRFWEKCFLFWKIRKISCKTFARETNFTWPRSYLNFFVMRKFDQNQD